MLCVTIEFDFCEHVWKIDYFPVAPLNIVYFTNAKLKKKGRQL